MGVYNKAGLGLLFGFVILKKTSSMLNVNMQESTILTILKHLQKPNPPFSLLLQIIIPIFNSQNIELNETKNISIIARKKVERPKIFCSTYRSG